MSLSLQVAGYDKQTERLSISHPVPQAMVGIAQSLAQVGADDDGEGAYFLEAHAALALGAKLDTKLNPDLYDWFLEPAHDD